MGKNDTCSKVQNIEEMVDTIEKNNVDDKVEDNIIPLNQFAVSHLKFFAILWYSSKRKH